MFRNTFFHELKIFLRFSNFSADDLRNSYDFDEASTKFVQAEKLSDVTLEQTTEQKFSMPAKLTIGNTSLNVTVLDYLMDEMRKIRTSLDSLRQLVSDYLIEKKNVTLENLASEVVFVQNSSDSLNVTLVNDSFNELVIYNKSEFRFNKSEPLFKIKLSNNTIWFFDVLYQVYNDTNTKFTNFMIEVTSDVYNSIYFSVFLGLIAMFLFGTCYLVIKQSICKGRFITKEFVPDIEAVKPRDPIIHIIENPVLLHTTNAENLVDRATVIGNVDRPPKRLERVSSFSYRKPSFTSFGIQTPPPPPIRISSLPNSPNLRNRKKVSFFVVPPSVPNINVRKETEV